MDLALVGIRGFTLVRRLLKRIDRAPLFRSRSALSARRGRFRLKHNRRGVGASTASAIRGTDVIHFICEFDLRSGKATR